VIFYYKVLCVQLPTGSGKSLCSVRFESNLCQGKCIVGGSGVVAILLSSCSFLLMSDEVSYIFTVQMKIWWNHTCSPSQYTSTRLVSSLMA